MSAHGSLRTRLADAGRAVLAWVDATVSGRRALARERAMRRSVQHHLSEQIRINALLITEHRDGSGGAE